MKFRDKKAAALCAAVGILATWVAFAGTPGGKGGKVSKQKSAKKTWVEIGGKVYGAKPDARGAIGGGAGYKKVVTRGDFRPRTLDGLLAALAKAKKGQVVFLGAKVSIDLTARTYTEKTVIEIPAGVTLAGDRGRGGSPGAIIFSDAFQTRPMIRTGGVGVRITGLRLRGPDPKRRLEHHGRAFKGKRGRKYYYKFPVSNGILAEHSKLEVDNCELSGWSHAAVHLKSGKGHRIHHNYIHHNQYNGLGYGVCHAGSFSLIACNLFNYNRHSIAGTGQPGSGYEASNNVEMGVSLSHCFDMHGGADRGDGTNIAGDWMKFRHNTFRAPNTAIRIRGLPREKIEVQGNWFSHASAKSAVKHLGKTTVGDNAFGLTKPTTR